MRVLNVNYRSIRFPIVEKEVMLQNVSDASLFVLLSKCSLVKID